MKVACPVVAGATTWWGNRQLWPRNLGLCRTTVSLNRTVTDRGTASCHLSVKLWSHQSKVENLCWQSMPRRGNDLTCAESRTNCEPNESWVTSQKNKATVGNRSPMETNPRNNTKQLPVNVDSGEPEVKQPVRRFDHS